MLESFVDAPDVLATQSTAQIKLNFSEFETSVNKITLNRTFFAFNKRHCRRTPVLKFDDQYLEEVEQDVMTQFSQAQNNQRFDLHDHMEWYCNVLPVFGCNSGKFGINLIKSSSLPVLVTDRGIEPIVIKRANKFVCLKFGDVQ